MPPLRPLDGLDLLARLIEAMQRLKLIPAQPWTFWRGLWAAEAAVFAAQMAPTNRTRLRNRLPRQKFTLPTENRREALGP
jgi:hypothetical protein